jgi:hypothetical protein
VIRSAGGVGGAFGGWHFLRDSEGCVLPRFDDATDDDCLQVSMTITRGIVSLFQQLTGKGLFDVHHLPRARLHKAEVVLPAPVHAIFRGNLPVSLQVALVARDEADRQDLVLLQPVLALHINHLREVVERLERAGLGDVVDQQESVAFEVRLRPEAAVFFLASSVREAEGVGRAVDRSRYRVGVLNCRVVPAKFTSASLIQYIVARVLRAHNILMRPLAAHQAQRNRRLSTSTISAHSDRNAVRVIHRSGERVSKKTGIPDCSSDCARSRFPPQARVANLEPLILATTAKSHDCGASLGRAVTNTTKRQRMAV